MVRSVDDVLITDELSSSPSLPPDHEAESRTLWKLAEQLAAHPDEVLQTLVELAVEPCHADSALVCALEPQI